MRIHQFPVSCTVCGGEGVGTIQTAGAAWDPRNEIRHQDPRVCADNLRCRAEALECREQLEETQ